MAIQVYPPTTDAEEQETDTFNLKLTKHARKMCYMGFQAGMLTIGIIMWKTQLDYMPQDTKMKQEND